MSEIYPLSSGRDNQGTFTLAGHNLLALAFRFGTPFYAFDAETVRSQITRLLETLEEYPGRAEIAYAAKAYLSLGLARKLAAFDLGVDVVSQGELNIARQAGFPPNRIHMHGNNKSDTELEDAVLSGIQSVVVDSLEELCVLEKLAAKLKRQSRIWLRITPGITVDTHPYRQTAHAASKFGLLIEDGSASEGICTALKSPWLKLTGIHTHLGSQIFEIEPYVEAVKMLLNLAAAHNYQPEELSPGGGWGVPYTTEDKTIDPRVWVKMISEAIQSQCHKHGFRLPKLVFEPGRWLVARAGVAVYTIGIQKQSANGIRMIAVDGGMADNIRPALYHADYSACVVETPDAPAIGDFRVVGKFCESGDELIPCIRLPEVTRGQHLLLPVAGAYQLSMASNYNLAPRPAVLWLEDGKVEVFQHREDPSGPGWWKNED